MRLFARRARSREEIEQRLLRRGCDPATVESVVKSLERQGIINDPGFAREWIEGRLRTSPRSRELLALELGSKGVSPDIVERAFTELPELPDDTEVARELVRRRYFRDGTMDGRSRARAYRMLVRRGFSRDVAEEVIGFTGDV